MGQLKEADFIRWGNTKRMTGLRKAEQDGLWEGIKERKLCLNYTVGFMHIKSQIISTSTGVSRPK